MQTKTTTQLLESLLDASNSDAWTAFDHRYRPVLFAFGRKLGLSEADAAEAAQCTLADFSKDYCSGRYNRSRARLRSWLIGIAQNRIESLRRERDRRESVHEHIACGARSREEANQDWDHAMHRVAMERAVAALHEESRFDSRTIRAFELCAVRGVPAEAVARECDMTVAEVYVAKNRVIRKLRESVAMILKELDGE